MVQRAIAEDANTVIFRFCRTLQLALASAPGMFPATHPPPRHGSGPARVRRGSTPPPSPYKVFPSQNSFQNDGRAQAPVSLDRHRNRDICINIFPKIGLKTGRFVEMFPPFVNLRGCSSKLGYLLVISRVSFVDLIRPVRCFEGSVRRFDRAGREISHAAGECDLPVHGLRRIRP